MRYAAVAEALPGASAKYVARSAVTLPTGLSALDGIAPKPEQGIKTGAGAACLSASNLALLEALLIRAQLNPDDFGLAVQEVQQPAHIEDLKALITVTCSAPRLSRTYFAGSNELGWFVDFSDDIQAGVFTRARGRHGGGQ